MKKFFLLIACLSLYDSAFAITCVNLQQNLTKGSESISVLKLQSFLLEKGYFSLIPNGHFGQHTFSSVIKYQKSVGISGSGAVLSLTRNSIKKDSCEDYIPGLVKVSTSTIAASSSQIFATKEATSTQVSNFGIFTESVPNSPGLYFIPNSVYVKLGTVTIRNFDSISVLKSLTLKASSTPKSLQEKISNYTITDISTGVVTNGNGVFLLKNEELNKGTFKSYELYANIDEMNKSLSGKVTFSGDFLITENNSTSTKVVPVQPFSIFVGY